MIDFPYDVSRFSGAVFQNCIPPSCIVFVDDKVKYLVERGCVVKWAGRPRPGGLAAAQLRPRLVMTVSVEEQTKPRLIYDSRKLYNKRCKMGSIFDGTVVRVDNVAPRGCYMTSL